MPASDPHTATMTPPLCDDCAPRSATPPSGPPVYAVCSQCGIKRACIGHDPDPQPPRASSRTDTSRP